VPDNSPALVVVAAGGLGTRVHPWARFIPKEFYPVAGRPGIAVLLEEIAALGPARVVIVYHPYYEQFAAWARQVLSRHDHARYRDAAGTSVPAAVPPGLAVTLIPQHGPYGDLTSVLNGASYLAAGDGLYVAFADNLYPGPAPLPRLRDACPRDVAVLGSSYRRALAGSRGILITRPGSAGGPRRVMALAEKPGPAEAIGLEEAHGPGNLLMLEGRARLTARFLEFARSRPGAGPGSEPRLALAIGDYAREHLVMAVPAAGDVIDLGVPETAAPGAASGAGGDRQPPVPAGAGPQAWLAQAVVWFPGAHGVHRQCLGEPGELFRAGDDAGPLADGVLAGLGVALGALEAARGGHRDPRAGAQQAGRVPDADDTGVGIHAVIRAEVVDVDAVLRQHVVLAVQARGDHDGQGGPLRSRGLAAVGEVAVCLPGGLRVHHQGLAGLPPVGAGGEQVGHDRVAQPGDGVAGPLGLGERRRQVGAGDRGGGLVRRVGEHDGRLPGELGGLAGGAGCSQRGPSL
jgi:UTP-glucose-1-phosphate uridylyltransferase